MSESARVSLCIPTYCRAAKLTRMLPTLVDAVDRHRARDRFEICISDNASPDETPEVIRATAAGSIAIRSVRQSENLGFAGNFAAVARLATADCFCILADDDELGPSALDGLLRGADLLSPRQPLAIFDSAPGGDALARKMVIPRTETKIDGPRQLVQRLGIFHASFVSNLLFHRETALTLLAPVFLRSRYPHVLLSLALLRTAPAIFLPVKLVQPHMPPDTGEQPLLTAVDMARVMTDHLLDRPECRSLTMSIYSWLVRMIPTAVLNSRLGRCRGDQANPYAALTPANLRQCYRRSRWFEFVALGFWALAHALPLAVLQRILRAFSRSASR